MDKENTYKFGLIVVLFLSLSACSSVETKYGTGSYQLPNYYQTNQVPIAHEFGKTYRVTDLQSSEVIRLNNESKRHEYIKNYFFE